MASTTQKEDHVQLKLLVNEESNKVVFAEAGKDFVDILCSFLTLPLGTIARLLQKDSNIGPVTVGCLNSLYQTVSNLDECLWTNTSKELLLYPRNSSEDYCSTLKFNIDDLEPTKYFMYGKEYCRSDDDYDDDHYFCGHGLILSTSANDKCPCCNSCCNRSIFLKPYCKGFVNSVATFVITDDLTIMPISMAYTSFSLLKNSGINTSFAKQMTINVTKEKVLDLLKCALVSKSPLTDVFLRKKPSIERHGFSSCYFDNSTDIQFTLQLVIRKSDENILFALGEQDFVDLLFSFLTFPLGGVVHKLGRYGFRGWIGRGYSSVSSIGRLYKSIVALDVKKYLVSQEAKERLVDPCLDSEFKSSKNILPIKKPRDHFYCYYQGENYDQSIINDQFFITEEYRSDDRKCVTINLVKALKHSATDEGYVKGPKTYLVTDDLVISPSSPISAQLLINRLQIPLDDLKEKVVIIGMNECLSILSAALISTSALTNGLRHLLSESKEEK